MLPAQASAAFKSSIVSPSRASIAHGARSARSYDARAFLYAFDLLELDGDDLRGEPLERRKARLVKMLGKARPGIRLNEHLDGDGAIIFQHACKLGLEGIVSKRRDQPYRSGRCKSWVKVKNPRSAAAIRVIDQNWT